MCNTGIVMRVAKQFQTDLYSIQTTTLSPSRYNKYRELLSMFDSFTISRIIFCGVRSFFRARFNIS
jgi:hypothetical protein